MKVAERIRSFVKESPIAYRVWFGFYARKKRYKTSLPTRTDDLYLDGFPRSGNTYFTAAIQSNFPEIRFANHLHVIAPIKLAIREKLPVFILMRKPEDAVASYVLHIKHPNTQSSKSGKSIDELGEMLLKQWFDYYSFVWKVKSEVDIVVSESAFLDPPQALNSILSKLPAFTDEGEIYERWREFHQAFEQRDRIKPQGSTSYPSESRDLDKRKVKDMFQENVLLSECHGIYEALKKDAVVGN